MAKDEKVSDNNTWIHEGKPFVAVCYPEEEKKGVLDWIKNLTSPNDNNNYNGYKWITRPGIIEVPWGLKDEVSGFWANGIIKFERKNVNYTTFIGRGFPFVEKGGVSILYECELGEDGFYGYTIEIRKIIVQEFKRYIKVNGEKKFIELLKNLSDFEETDFIKKLMVDQVLSISEITFETSNDNENKSKGE